MKFLRKVIHGEKLGRKLGFPTVNFHVRHFGDHFDPGIYACLVYLKRSAVSPPLSLRVNSQRSAETQKKGLQASSFKLQAYKGALYFGPKGSGKNVLEIHILDFKDNLYGQFLPFEVGKRIRSPKKFISLNALKKRIAEDIKLVLKLEYLKK